MTWTKKSNLEKENFDQKEFENYLDKDKLDLESSDNKINSKDVHPAWDFLFFFSSIRSAVMIVMIFPAIAEYGLPGLMALNFKPIIWEMLLLLSHAPGLIGMLGFFRRKAWGWWLLNMSMIQNIIVYALSLGVELYFSKVKGSEFQSDQVSIVLTMLFTTLILIQFNSPVLQQKLKVNFTAKKMMLISLIALLYGLLFTIYSIVFNV